MSPSILAFHGTLAGLDAAARARLIDRGAERDPRVRESVAATIARVRREGDEALRALMAEYHGVTLESLEVPRAARRAALDALDPGLRAALERAIGNIERAHRAQLPRASEVETEPGVFVGRRPDPLARVGAYAPGGRAAYPSSVLMTVVPAKVAGVGEVILCTPPGPSGAPADVILAAAALAGADRVFALGGAAAIAAMAYGTASVPRVDRIVGPGNAYVAEAKLQVADRVSIDAPAGPSELLVIADASADPGAVALEMLAQAEHDPDAIAVAVAIGGALATQIEQALERALADPALPRRDVIAAALAARGAVLSTGSVEHALAFAADFAPEHLLLALAGAAALAARARNAGTVFIGLSSSNAFGDYMTGANHTLPTAGLARAWSGLSTLDFVRWTTTQRVTPAAAVRLAGDVAAFAEAEGLHGHAAAARRAGERAASAAPEALAPLDLDDNTNAYGPPPAAIESLASQDATRTHRYPTAYGTDLKRALADYAGVTPDHIITGCGSDDVLDAAFKVLGAPGERVAYCVPTFSMIPLFADVHGLEAVEVPFTSKWDLDADLLLAARASLVYLCSPNNPTGTVASEEAIARVVAKAPGHVILDEAYAEFATADGSANPRWTKAVARLPRLIVVRTLSKAFGLAGLRVGYGIAEPTLVAALERARGPYKVSVQAEQAAVAAIEGSRQWVRSRAAEVASLRERFRSALESAGAAPLPSAANFLLVPVPDAAAAAAALAARGVRVRAFDMLPGIGQGIRITVGPWPMMERTLDAMRDAGLFAGGGPTRAAAAPRGGVR